MRLILNSAKEQLEVSRGQPGGSEGVGADIMLLPDDLAYAVLEREVVVAEATAHKVLWEVKLVEEEGIVLQRSVSRVS